MLHQVLPSEIKPLFYQLLDSPNQHLPAKENALAQGHALSRLSLYPVINQHKDRNHDPWFHWSNSERSSQLQGSWWQGLPCVCILTQCLLPASSSIACVDTKNMLLADLHQTLLSGKSLPDLNCLFGLRSVELPREVAGFPSQTPVIWNIATR